MTNKEPEFTKFSKAWGWHFVTAGLLFLFAIVDSNLQTFPSWLAWLVFFPLNLAKVIADNSRLPDDHAVLFAIFVGFPALIIYWYYGYTLFFRFLNPTNQTLPQRQGSAKSKTPS